MDRAALILAIIGAINWGSIGIFNYDLLGSIFGGYTTMSRIVFSIVGLAGLWCISLLFRDRHRSRVEDL